MISKWFSKYVALFRDYHSWKLVSMTFDFDTKNGKKAEIFKSLPPLDTYSGEWYYKIGKQSSE